VIVGELPLLKGVVCGVLGCCYAVAKVFWVIFGVLPLLQGVVCGF